MRLIVCGGGTGGHVYPALAVVAALEEPPLLLERADLLYLGTRGRAEEELATRAGLAFAPIAAGAVRGRGPLALVGSLLSLIQGSLQAWAILGRFRPDAILATGGYVSVPVVLAAWLRRVPVLVYLPDVLPGLAVRCLALFARTLAVSAEPALEVLPRHKTVVTGYPVRPGFGQEDRAAARSRLGLDLSLKTLLVWGGSQGARAINRQVALRLSELLRLCQVIHVCGAADAPWLHDLQAGLPAELRPRYHLYPYLFEGMAEAMAAADLAICRAGASVLGELPASALPAILVPGAFAGAHQAHNARYLAEAGGALLLAESRLEELAPTATALLQDDARLRQMSQRVQALARPEAARKIAGLLIELAGRPSAAAKPGSQLPVR
ncbi:MAG: UDP-N-acetylglucosamine--N-acetylmuramyl-(pentapeptide) pyrophosphoryl-undecaprenol N-acetylglucosamine transferase [Chloroflexi bacterium]|nr:UDP-N-acetylglucosamine--N-acetylmuramyl-(pentapeptide) pyrophosphoryl-undecaprenol N-acetylglucosamine transferase [Chloroflexota bacterium]